MAAKLEVVISLICSECGLPPEDCGDDEGKDKRYYCHHCETWLKDEREI